MIHLNFSVYLDISQQGKQSLVAGLSSLGEPGVPWHPHFVADQLTLSQPRGADYAHQLMLAPPAFQTFLRPWVEITYG